MQGGVCCRLARCMQPGLGGGCRMQGARLNCLPNCAHLTASLIVPT